MGWTNKSTAGSGGEFKRIELAEEESFEGRYVGPQDLTGVNGDFVSHEFEVEGDDSRHTISGASLNRGLADVEPGTLTRITFKGMVITKSKRTCKAYDIAVYAEDAPAAKSGKSF